MGRSRLEWIEVDGDDVDGAQALLRQLLHMLEVGPVGQDAGMYPRVQSLDATVHQLGEPGQLGDRRDLHAGCDQRIPGAAGRVELDAQLLQAAGEFRKPGPVGNGENCPQRLRSPLVRRWLQGTSPGPRSIPG